MKTTKKEKLNLVQWGDICFEITIRDCKKCGSLLTNLKPFGITCLSVCKKCKKFYGLVIQDVTSKLTKGFKKNNL